MPRGKRKAADPLAGKLAPRICHWSGCGRRFTPDTTSRYHCSDGCAAACLKERMGEGK